MGVNLSLGVLTWSRLSGAWPHRQKRGSEVTTAELYPNIVLGASAEATGLAVTMSSARGLFRWSVGPLVSWSFPNLQAARSRVAGARADSRAAPALFDASVLQALEETGDGVIKHAMALDRRAALRVAPRPGRAGRSDCPRRPA